MATLAWFCAGANHGRSTDVDLLNNRVALGATGNCLHEWVKVDHNQLESLDVEFSQLLLVLNQTKVGQQSGVHLWVQSLDAAVEALGETGNLRNLGDGVTGIGDGLGG